MIKLFALLFLVACASQTKEQAKKLTENGLHEAAIEKWLQAYKEDPNDVDVQIGLKISQEKALNDRLVKIRELRTSGDFNGAIQGFREVRAVQKKWGVSLDYNSSSFLGKEAEALWSVQKQRISDLTNQGKPLAAEYLRVNTETLFYSMNDFESVKSFIFKKGIELCQSEQKKSETSPFYSNFVDKMCNYFGGPKRNKTLKHLRTDSLYSKLNKSISISGVDYNLSAILQNKLDTVFRSSPWFHVEGDNQLEMSVYGIFKEEMYSENIRQIHQYNVEVPYKATERVMKTKYVPYTAYEQRCNSYGCQSVPVLKNRVDTYYENVEVTKYRTETYDHYYTALSRTQTFIMNITGRIKTTDGKGFTIPFSKEDSRNYISHEVMNTNIGLYPVRVELERYENKYAYFVDLYAYQFQVELNKAWTQQFCTYPQINHHGALADNVFKCKRSSTYSKDFVDSWFKSHYGLTSVEAESVLGGI